MGNYDIREAPRDELQLFLKTAKEGLEKYTICRVEAANCTNRIAAFDESKKEANKKKIGWLVFTIISFTIVFFAAISIISSNTLAGAFSYSDDISIMLVVLAISFLSLIIFRCVSSSDALNIFQSSLKF